LRPKSQETISRELKEEANAVSTLQISGNQDSFRKEKVLCSKRRFPKAWKKGNVSGAL